MTFKVVEHTVATAVPGGGNFTVAYPAGTNEGDFEGAVGHEIVTESNDRFVSPDNFTLTFGTASIQVNWGASQTTLAANTKLFVQLDQRG